MKIMFIGLGLIGGSMALALEGYPNLERYAVDGDEPTRLEASFVRHGRARMMRPSRIWISSCFVCIRKRRRILSVNRRAESSPVRC